MSNCCNKCIRCGVKNCRFHAGDENFCTLRQISVGTHETDPKYTECTDCESFEKK